MRGALLVALTGCSSIFGLHDPMRGGAADARASDGTDGHTTDGSLCVGRGDLAVCFDAMPTSAVQLPATISTAADSTQCSTSVHWTSNQQPAVCFIAGQNVTQSGTVNVTGGRPLVVVALDTLDIGGTLDASSHIASGILGGGVAGPGADPASCGAFATMPVAGGQGGGGGAGGSFVSAGGAGGAGNGGNNAGGTAGTAVTASTVLRGGCAGQQAAIGGNGASLGTVGDGGGAIYLVAGAHLVIQATGAVTANGAGAAAPSNRAGGAGGGTGGMIVLDAPMIDFGSGAILMANGGGGAAGADGNTGLDGSDPSLATPTMPAPGGGTGRGGVGGVGAAISAAAGNGGDAASGQARGGGGGGGGIGVIYAPSSPGPGASVSPSITLLP